MESNSKKLIDTILTEVIEINGARGGEDNSIYAGIGYLKDIPITFIAQIREFELDKCKKTNFSMTTPVGYRKIIRLARQAERFKRPILIFVDTIGADACEESEREGQAYRIAECMYELMEINSPIISILCGQGGSGGALALCVADRILATQNGYLGVASLKACRQIIGAKYERYSDEIYLNAERLKDVNLVNRILETNYMNEIYVEVRKLKKRNLFILKNKRIKKYRKWDKRKEKMVKK